MAQPYRHQPLESPDSIRLLDLLPALKWDAPVKCRIRQMTFETARDKYEALSYVWGALEGNHSIDCNGGELLVTPNCHDAIIHLRRRVRVRTLWIDSICIDQRKTPDSTQERNHQIKNMGLLYQNASRVLVWLGPNSTGLKANTIRPLKLALHYTSPYNLPFILFDKISKPLFDNFEDFYTLFNSPWFVRMWTVQPLYIRYTHSALGDSTSPSSQLQFLLSLKIQQSTLIHDKIYVVYAILSRMGIEIPEPDYSKPAKSVLEEFTRACISFLKQLDLITSEMPGGDSPTWIPDYISQPRKIQSFVSVNVNGRVSEHLEYLYRASGSSQAFMDNERHSGKLVVKGKRVDFVLSRIVCPTVHTATSNPSENDRFRDFVPVCQNWCQSCTVMLQNPEQTVYWHSESLRRAAQRAVTVSFSDNEDCTSWWDLMLYPDCSKLSAAQIRDSARRHNPTLMETHQQLPSEIIFDYLESQENDPQSPFEHIQWRANKFINWAFLVTNSGYLGRAYRTCQEGDQLWLLVGSANPVILRQSGGEYQYIAPAFFDGMMDGELWPDIEEELEFLTLI
ncbi:hypothetical protein PG993_011383 [Apiospora rasikravindrae]|uniref:Heterokaryon incompatibility domain-containing protein n=1 Tax=Apiospora rasikravindrae TaxID=990691 RepID=A0ABR1SE39_9PEZI